MTGHEIALAASAAVMVLGGIGTAFSRDVTRLVLSLGSFLLGVAFAFLLLGNPLLAAAQVFLYVGGVLVLVLFALMVVRRGDGERPRVESRPDAISALVAIGVFLLLAVVLAPAMPDAAPAAVHPAQIAEYLLGEGMVAFELVGVVLLAAFLAVLVIVKGGEDR